MHFYAVFQLLKSLDIGILRIVPVLELFHIIEEITDNRPYISLGVETQHVGRFLKADLVIAEVLNVLYVQVDSEIQALLDRTFYQVGDLTNGVVSRSDVE